MQAGQLSEVVQGGFVTAGDVQIKELEQATSMLDSQVREQHAGLQTAQQQRKQQVRSTCLCKGPGNSYACRPARVPQSSGTSAALGAHA